MARFSALSLVLFSILASLGASFAPKNLPKPELRLAENKNPLKLHSGLEAKIAAATAFVAVNVPLAALAEEDYEYGAVDAPIGLAWGVGVLAILSALLPLALKGGEEAFEEMREQETFGTGKDVLNKRK